MLVEADPDTRWRGARALAAAPTAVAALASALANETSGNVREAIFTSLVLIRSPESAGALALLLRSDEASLRTGALDALSAMADVARPLIPGLLRDADPDVRILSCDLVRGLAADEATDLLCAILDVEPEPNVCGAAVDVLAELGTPAAAGPLERCAARFPPDSFLSFAIREAVQQVTSQRSDG
jgi:HEAT repeat protein